MTILIATAGARPDLLRRTLESLAACDAPRNLQRTVIIENGPTPRCAKIVETFGATYLHEPVGNKSAALNIAMRDITDGLVFFSDDDVTLAPRTLTGYERAAAEQGDGYYFGGPVEPDYLGEPPPPWLVRFLPASARGWRAPRGGVIDGVSPFLGFNWAAWARDIHAAGGFDPSRGPGAASGATGQESDMQRRLTARGLKPFYVPEALVHHAVPPQRCSPRWMLRRAYRTGVSGGIVAAQQGRWGSAAGGPYRSRAFLTLLSLASRVRQVGKPIEQRRFVAGYWRQVKRGVRDGYATRTRTSSTCG